MYDYSEKGASEPGAASCPCTVDANCTISTKCECFGFCPLYESYYNSMVSPVYITISPDMREFGGKSNARESLLDTWHSRFKKWTRHLSKCIIVLELGSGYRPRYHIIAEIKNKYGHSTTLYQWGLTNNVKQHGKFTKGLHYIFKECHSTYLSVHRTPVWEFDDFKTVKRTRSLPICSYKSSLVSIAEQVDYK